MELEITAAGEPVGRFRMSKNGLYQDCEAVCTPKHEGIFRLYVWNGDDCVCLGVPVPEGGAFVLRRRVSSAGLPFLPERAVLGTAFGEWLPWRGTFDGAEIPFAWRKAEPDSPLALPEDAGLPEALRQRPSDEAVIGGEHWLLFPEDVPEPAPKQSKEDDPKEAAGEDGGTLGYCPLQTAETAGEDSGTSGRRPQQKAENAREKPEAEKETAAEEDATEDMQRFHRIIL